ncbi:hypothetical protein [Paracholeplasma manati]|uniref:hypothetical protein n=1 Tax=Paracholeplasma manati TaxID=591373 RepID=UPI002407E298|nr:hypothetical protein [Paracholeplasma manati]MDG0888935.1 hypothetical protein [Paracholeplasma manati]
MSNYQLLFQKKHITYTREPVVLEEYIGFLDQKESRKFMVLKLQNNSNHPIQTITIRVSQLNHFNQSMKTSEYTLEDIKLDAFKSIVSLERITVEDDCTSIEVNLLKAISKTHHWENGQWHKLESTETKSSIQPKTQLIKPERLHFPLHISLYMTIVYAAVLVMVYFALRSFS